MEKVKESITVSMEHTKVDTAGMSRIDENIQNSSGRGNPSSSKLQESKGSNSKSLSQWENKILRESMKDFEEGRYTTVPTDVSDKEFLRKLKEDE